MTLGRTHINGFEICVNATVVFFPPKWIPNIDYLFLGCVWTSQPDSMCVLKNVFFLPYDPYFIFESSHWLLNKSLNLIMCRFYFSLPILIYQSISIKIDVWFCNIFSIKQRLFSVLLLWAKCVGCTVSDKGDKKKMFLYLIHIILYQVWWEQKMNWLVRHCRRSIKENYNETGLVLLITECSVYILNIQCKEVAQMCLNLHTLSVSFISRSIDFDLCQLKAQCTTLLCNPPPPSHD